MKFQVHVGIAYRVGKFNNWLNFSNFDLLGIQRVMLGPTALPFDSFSDFTRNYIPDYPQIYLCSRCDVNDHTVGPLAFMKVVHTHKSFHMDVLLISELQQDII